MFNDNEHTSCSSTAEKVAAAYGDTGTGLLSRGRDYLRNLFTHSNTASTDGVKATVDTSPSSPLLFPQEGDHDARLKRHADEIIRMDAIQCDGWSLKDASVDSSSCDLGLNLELADLSEASANANASDNANANAAAQTNKTVSSWRARLSKGLRHMFGAFNFYGNSNYTALMSPSKEPLTAAHAYPNDESDEDDAQGK